MVARIKTKLPNHSWLFKRHFRTNSFGWSASALARKRLKEALSEIKKVARKDSRLAAYGIVELAKRLWPALQGIDSSSGALGSAVYTTLLACVPIFSSAVMEEDERNILLERIFEAIEEDGVDYLFVFRDKWGDLCASESLASKWVDELIDTLRMCWSQYEPGNYYSGSIPCLSALLKAGRHKELSEILELCPNKLWHYHKFKFWSLVEQGKKSEAIRFAQGLTDELNQSVGSIYEACEEVLISSGLYEEAYEKFGLLWTERNSNLATFRAIAKKYPQIDVKKILADLVSEHPGQEGKWFATAKELGEYDFAIDLANKSPCDPKTLSRAAEKHIDTHPKFSMNSGLAAIKWLCEGQGYEITNIDIVRAFQLTIVAAEKIGQKRNALRQLLSYVSCTKEPFIKKSLEFYLEK